MIAPKRCCGDSSSSKNFCHLFPTMPLDATGKGRQYVDILKVQLQLKSMQKGRFWGGGAIIIGHKRKPGAGL